MTKFTIEDLRDIAYRGSYDDLERELALQLLSSIEQAPVYLRPFGDDGETFVSCDGNDERAITLYAAPQLPQPAAVSVPAAMEMDDDFDSAFEHGKAVGWNAYRAAMLQGAKPVTTAYKLRDAVETIRNSGIEIDAEKIFAERDALNAPDCWCRTCRPVTISDMRFVVCPECGNKRCPHANDHRNACTGSNEPGQEGSAYPAAPQQEVNRG
ncbi:hypothetical protein K7H59_001418 [Escherichia coli]|nr:hypothetical protein [Escherichia coli]